MFRSELSNKLYRIFGFKKNTFDAPSGESHEQETLFIEVTECHSRITEGKIFSKVMGSLIVFSQLDKLPYGFFSKKIELAPHDVKKDFYFFDIDVSPASSPVRFQNISERRVGFLYFYSAQHDPAHGQITTLEGIL